MAKKGETTTKFKVDISDLKAAMQEAKRQVALANSEFKAASSSMTNWSKTSDGLSAKLKQLKSNLEAQKTVLSVYEKTLADVTEEYGENSKEAQEYLVKLNNQKAVVNNLAKEINVYSESLNKAEKAEEIANRTGEDSTKVFDELGSAVEDTGKAAAKSSEGFTVMKGAIAELIADGIEKAITALKNFAKEAVNTGIDFESAMSEVGAISGATAEEMAILEETAKRYGSTTVFSASEAAQALKYMALAGWDVQQSTSALGGILDLAASSGMELAQASDMVTDYMSAFGMEANKAGYFADLLAYAQSHANTSAQQLGEAYRNTAANMNAAGQDIETVTSLLSMMANQGYKGSEAGTALTAIMRDLTKKMDDGAIAIGETVVTVQDANGNFRDLTEILKDVANATDGMGDAERAAALSTTFTADSTKGLNLILNAGIDEAEQFEEALRGAGGSAEAMGNMMTDNVAGDIKGFQSALEGVKLEVYKELQPTIRKFIQYMTKDGIKTIRDLAKSFTELFKKILPYVEKGFKALTKVVTFAVDNFETLATVILGGVAAFKAIQAAMAIANTVSAFSTTVRGAGTAIGLAQKAQLLWNAAMSANPIGAVITAVALLTAGVAAYCIALGDTNKQQDVLTESQRELVNSAKESAEAFKENKNAADEMAASNIANIDYVQQLYGELETLATASGVVKTADKERAEFILNELNNALGTEYKMNGDVISQYQSMREEIAKLIEAKKAEVLLTTYEDSYKEAITNVGEAEKARATQLQELAALEEDATAKQEAFNKSNETYMKHLKEAGNNESKLRALASEAEANAKLLKSSEDATKALEEAQNAYRETDAAVQEYYQTIDAYESASGAMLVGNTQDAITALTELGDGFQTAASTAKLSAEEQKKVLEQQVIDTEVNLKLLEKDYADNQSNMTDEQKRQAEERIRKARDEADKAKEEFKKVGGNISQGIANGVGESGWILEDAMTKLIDDALKAAEKAAEIHSPSRLFKNAVGKYIGLGVASGITDSTKDVINSVKAQVMDIKSAYTGSIGQFTVNSKDANNTAGTNTNVVNNFTQINNSPKALSRLEIYRQSKNLLGYAGGGL